MRVTLLDVNVLNVWVWVCAACCVLHGNVCIVLCCCVWCVACCSESYVVWVVILMMCMLIICVHRVLYIRYRCDVMFAMLHDVVVCCAGG